MPADIHNLPPKGHSTRFLALGLLFLVPVAFGILALWLGQDANWDLRNYHWYNAYAFLNGRYGIDLLPSQTPWFYNPLLDVPFYLLATHVPARVAGFALGLLEGLNFVLLFRLAYVTLVFARPGGKVLLCAALAMVGMLGGGGLALLGTTFYDNVTSLGLFASALLVIRHFETLNTASWKRAFTRALLFGLPAGLMMGLKLPCVIFCVGLDAAFLFMPGSARRRSMLGFAFGLGVLLGVAITYGPWAWFLETHFGSPLFPYFNDIFKSSLAPAASARDIQFIPNNKHDFLLFPFIFALSPYRVGEIPWRDWSIPFLYAALPLALLAHLAFGRARGRIDAAVRPHAARYLLWVTAISYAAWVFLFSIYRYLVPLEMLAPLLVVLTCDLLPVRPQPRALITAFVLLVLAVTVQPGTWGRRAQWLDHFVEASIPPLGDTSNLMILMAGFEPYSHLVTQLPPEVLVVRIQSNFASPGEDKGINAVIAARVAQHQGRFMLLIPTWQHQLADEALAHFNLAAIYGSCQPVIDRLYDDKALDLCTVKRLK
jgi:hypothetical protein